MAEYTDEELLRIGVPEEMLDYVRSFTNADDFKEAEKHIPKDSFENLSFLIEGVASLSEILKSIEEQMPEDSGNTLYDSLKCPATLESFVVIEGQDDLQKIMEESLEEWRVFLHPLQRLAATKDYFGPAMVLGGAGTGKTVVLLHRAKYLASKCEGNQKILFTTFTANLAKDIEENLKKICSEEEMNKIDVINLDKWINQFLREKKYPKEIIYEDNDYKNMAFFWETAVGLAENGLSYKPSFYREEWEQVVTNLEEITVEQYINADRKHRGNDLSLEEREQIWKVFEKYMEQMDKFNCMDVCMAMHEGAKMLREEKKPRYDHVIVDEGQHVSLEDYGTIENIKAIAKNKGAKIITTDKLVSQFRCGGSSGYLDWLDSTLQIKEDDSNENEKTDLKGVDYDFRVFDSPQALWESICERNDNGGTVGSRVVAGYCWEWPYSHRNDPDYHDIKDIPGYEDFEMSWNLENRAPQKNSGNKGGKYTPKYSYAYDEDSINQVGCIHTVQGLDFDYVGVIIGNDMRYEDGKIVTDRTERASTDVTLRGIEDTEDPDKVADEIIKNTYRVLMSRGMKGCYVFCVDDGLKEYLIERSKKE